MSITKKSATSYVKELVDGGIHASTDVYKAALIKTGHSGTFDASTANYSTLGTDEVANGNGYTTGGITLGQRTVTVVGEEVHINFSDPGALANCTFSADGVLIYNSTKAGRALGVYPFSSAKVPQGGSFTLDLPDPGTTSLFIL